MGGPKPTVKSFEIDKRLVYEAWRKVRANQGACCSLSQWATTSSA